MGLEGLIFGDGAGVLFGVGGEFGFRRGDVDIVEEIEGEGFDLFEVVVVGEEGGEFFLAAVESTSPISLGVFGGPS